MSVLPVALIAAFRAAEQAEHLGTMMVEDGWDADAMRVLSATQHIDQRWIPPRQAYPAAASEPLAAELVAAEIALALARAPRDIAAATQRRDAARAALAGAVQGAPPPSAAAWSWLMSGWEPDLVQLATTAGVSVPTARKKWLMLANSRLIYPDGSMTKWALAALKKHVAKRLGATGKRKDKPGGGDDAN